MTRIRPRRHLSLSPRAVACLLGLCAGAVVGAAEPAATAKGPQPSAQARAGSAAEARPAPASDAAPADALEQLRQRLAERLAKGRPGAAGGPNDLRIAVKAPAAGASTAAAAPVAAKRPHAPGHGATAKAGKHGEPAQAAHWDYQGAGGPAAWSGLKPEFALCSSGQRQSPIDIRGGLAVDLDPVRFDYQASKFTVLDNGHTVQVNLAPGNAIEVGGRRFELQQFHFHRPSEERIDGRQFEISLHLVHKDSEGRLAVVALLFDPGPAQAVVQQVWNNLPLERGQEAPARAPLQLPELLPVDRSYYTYMGSLTTPPCSEGVQWIVMRQPVTLTPEQIEIFARIYPMNARPLQQASGRRILQSN